MFHDEINIIAGIDYGSKLAGTTAIAFFNANDEVLCKSSMKNKDADTFLIDEIEKIGCNSVFIDAPLSLPGAYFGMGEDYFYRECDRSLKAMSPMFLGGLTARAMQLSKKIMLMGVSVRETYPSAIQSKIDFPTGIYKKGNLSKDILDIVESSTQFKISTLPNNWHELDAILCLWAGRRFHQACATEIGNAKEGIIYI